MKSDWMDFFSLTTKKVIKNDSLGQTAEIIRLNISLDMQNNRNFLDRSILTMKKYSESGKI